MALNSKADALSRVFGPEEPSDPVPVLPPALVVGPIVWEIDSEIRRASQQESTLSLRPGFLQTEPHPVGTRGSGHGSSWGKANGPAGTDKVLVAENDEGDHLLRPGLSHLKPFVSSVSHPPGDPTAPAQPEVVDQPGIYSVREVLNSHRRGGRLEYLVD